MEKEKPTLPMTVRSSQQQRDPSSNTLQSPPVSALTTTTVSMTLETLPNGNISYSTGIASILGASITASTSCSVFKAAVLELISSSDNPDSESDRLWPLFFLPRFRFLGFAVVVVVGAVVASCFAAEPTVLIVGRREAVTLSSEFPSESLESDSSDRSSSDL